MQCISIVYIHVQCTYVYTCMYMYVVKVKGSVENVFAE